MSGLMEKAVEYLRWEVSSYSRASFKRHLVSGTGGNLSIRVPGTQTALVTPTAVSLNDVQPEEVILVNLEGEIIDSPMGLKPSKETGLHLEAYKLRPDIGALAHLHPPHATAFANLMQPLPLVTVSARGILKHVPCVETAIPGSDELLQHVRKGIEENPSICALLMREHGILAMGKEMKTTYYVADLVEDTAKIAFVESLIKK